MNQDRKIEYPDTIPSQIADAINRFNIIHYSPDFQGNQAWFVNIEGLRKVLHEWSTAFVYSPRMNRNGQLCFFRRNPENHEPVDEVALTQFARIANNYLGRDDILPSHFFIGTAN